MQFCLDCKKNYMQQIYIDKTWNKVEKEKSNQIEALMVFIRFHCL